MLHKHTMFCIQCLMEAFHCVEPVERQTKLVPLVAALTTYEVFFNIGEKGSDEGHKKEVNDRHCIMHR